MKMKVEELEIAYVESLMEFWSIKMLVGCSGSRRYKLATCVRPGSEHKQSRFVLFRIGLAELYVCSIGT